ncbi:7652_t:CDS:2, partial [Acaulospora colombiana]
MENSFAENIQKPLISFSIEAITNKLDIYDEVCNNDGNKMPLWREKKDSLPVKNQEKIIPEARASIFSKPFFIWLDELLRIGRKKHLEREDLYFLNNERLARVLTDRFEKEWKKELEKLRKGKKPSLLLALNRVVGFQFWIAAVMRLIAYLSQVFSPLAIQASTCSAEENIIPSAVKYDCRSDEAIILFSTESFESKGNNAPSIYQGILLSTILFLMLQCYAITSNWCLWASAQCGLLVRTILITAIYRKALVLSGKARKVFTLGKITNIMSTDTTRIDWVSVYVHFIWATPLLLTIALVLLIMNIGLSALAGFGLMAIAGPLQGKIMQTLVSKRRKAAKMTDERVKTTQEVLQGIRMVKYYAWEESFLNNIEKLRIKETGYIRTLLVVPVFASILSFVIFVLVGGVLTPDIVFTSLALFSVVRFPLKLFPMVVAGITDAWVAFDRIQQLLMAEELEYLPPIDLTSDFAIMVTDGEFLWEMTPSTSDDIKTPLTDKEEVVEYSPSTISADDKKIRLSNINIRIKRGAHVAVVGSVGAGKSSLLSALIGEMKKIKGEVIFGGSVGYCSQNAWLRNATIRDNILFGRAFDEKKYKKIIKDCFLEPDLKLFPAGDMTEIGEKGINLSGGQKQRISIARAVYFDADIVLLDDPLSSVDAHVSNHLFTQCIQGALSEKTVILVTHQLNILSQVDHILCMENGRIVDQGTYEELMRDGKKFSALIEEYGKSDNNEEKKKAVYIEEITGGDVKGESSLDIPDKGMMTQEERLVGAVKIEVYYSYIMAAGGLFLIPLVVFLLVMMQASNLG